MNYIIKSQFTMKSKEHSKRYFIQTNFKDHLTKLDFLDKAFFKQTTLNKALQGSKDTTQFTQNCHS